MQVIFTALREKADKVCFVIENTVPADEVIEIDEWIIFQWESWQNIEETEMLQNLFKTLNPEDYRFIWVRGVSLEGADIISIGKGDPPIRITLPQIIIKEELCLKR